MEPTNIPKNIIIAFGSDEIGEEPRPSDALADFVKADTLNAEEIFENKTLLSSYNNITCLCS
jgi:hypothetical protein